MLMKFQPRKEALIGETKIWDFQKVDNDGRRNYSQCVKSELKMVMESKRRWKEHRRRLDENIVKEGGGVVLRNQKCKFRFSFLK